MKFIERRHWSMMIKHIKVLVFSHARKRKMLLAIEDSWNFFYFYFSRQCSPYTAARNWSQYWQFIYLFILYGMYQYSKREENKEEEQYYSSTLTQVSGSGRMRKLRMIFLLVAEKTCWTSHRVEAHYNDTIFYIVNFFLWCWRPLKSAIFSGAFKINAICISALITTPFWN